MSGTSTGSLDSNTVGLIVGITAVSTILIGVLITVIVIVCRNKASKRRDLDRSRRGAYILQNGSPYDTEPSIPGVVKQDSFGHGNPSNWSSSLPILNNVWTSEKSLSGNFRPNPLAENPFQRNIMPQQGVSMITLTGNGYYNNNYSGQHLANSMQALNSGHDNQAFFSKLYEKLSDTIHQDRGRPLYVCTRADYPTLSDHFDIVGKTRSGEWLVRPRPSVPNRPQKKHSNKKSKAPQPHGSAGSKPSKRSHERQRNSHDHHKNSSENRRGQSFQENPVSGFGRPVIATPFGAARRGQYLSGSHINLNNQVNFEQPQYTGSSLPRDGKYVSSSSGTGNGARPARLERSNSAVTQTKHMNEEVYKHVVNKNAISQHRTNGVEINGKAQVYTIEESPKLPTKSPKEMQLESTSPMGLAPHRERSGSTSTQKSLGITEQFKFLDDIQYSDEKF